MNRKKRLIKLVVASAVYDTRTKAEQAIRQGRVLVDGKPLLNPQYQIDPQKHDIKIGDKPLPVMHEKFYFAFHKPLDVTCEKNEVSNVYQFLRRLKLPEEAQRTLSCAGRLDKDTTGLLIFTNDGDFTHRLLSPTSGIKKTYEVVVKGYLAKEKAEQLRSGVTIPQDDSKRYTTKPAIVENIKGDEHKTSFIVTLKEGKKRQIRKMCEAVGHHVISLKRIRIGELRLSDLPRGQFRKITPQEVLEAKKPGQKESGGFSEVGFE